MADTREIVKGNGRGEIDGVSMFHEILTLNRVHMIFYRLMLLLLFFVGVEIVENVRQGSRLGLAGSVLFLCYP